jgi:hypothetical protein
MNRWYNFFTPEKIEYFKDLANKVPDAKSYIDEFHRNGIDSDGIKYFVSRLKGIEEYKIFKELVIRTVKNHGDLSVLTSLYKEYGFGVNEQIEADIISDILVPNVDWHNISTLVDHNSYVLSTVLMRVPIETKQEFKDIIFKNPYYAYIYARDILKGRLPSAVEDLIATDVRLSYEYALNVLKGRFLKGEDIISKDPLYAAKYAIDVVKTSFKEGEKAIAECPNSLLIEEYAKYCKMDRFPEGEARIIEGGSFVLGWYIEFLKKINKYDKFINDHPEVAEKIDSTTQAMSALDVHIPNIDELLVDKYKAKKALQRYIEERNKKAASYLIPIVQDPWLTYKYAEQFKEKVKDEWEDIIAKNGFASATYAEMILHSPFPKGEDAIAEDGYSSLKYASIVLHGPFPKGEDAIIRDQFSVSYAKKALKDRFIKAEDEIIKDKNALKYYVEVLEDLNKLDDFYKDHPEAKINISSGQIDILYNIHKQLSLDDDLLFKRLFSRRENMNIKLNDFLNSLSIEKVSKYFDTNYSNGKIERIGIGKRDGEAWVIQTFDIDEFESDPEIEKILKDDKLDDDKKLEKIKEIEEEKENSKNIELEELFSKPKISIKSETLYVSDDDSEVKKPSDLNVTDDANSPEEVKTKEGKTYKKVQK